MKQDTIVQGDPFVTVIMPVRNEAEWIAESVCSVLHQDYPSERVEILIADGSSDDQTVAIIHNLPDASRVQIIANPQRTQAAGMNRALDIASGDVIVRVDGHTIIPPNYICSCVEVLRETGAENVGGIVDPVGTTRMGQVIATALKSPFAVPTTFRISRRSQYTDTVYMGAWPRRVIDSQRFDESFAVNEDYEFNYRLRKAGGRIFFSAELCSEYHGRQSLRALAHQYFRYGFWKPKTLLKHPQSLRMRQLAAPLMVAFLIVGGVLSLSSSAFRTLWFSGIAAYLVAALIFSLLAAWRNGLWMLSRLPLVFVTLHLTWGSGFWIGTCYHLARRRSASAS